MEIAITVQVKQKLCYVAYDPEAEKRLVERIVQSICHCVSGFGVWMYGDTKGYELSEPQQCSLAKARETTLVDRQCVGH